MRKGILAEMLCRLKRHLTESEKIMTEFLFLGELFLFIYIQNRTKASVWVEQHIQI